MQSTAQGWLVLTELTHRDASAMGTVLGLQFAPRLLLLAHAGRAADSIDRRRLLMITQSLLGLLAFGLGALTIFGAVKLWEVYLFSLALGSVMAFDAPARQTFVARLVDRQDLANAVALNSANYNVSRMIGPAIAGVFISAVGTGWMFLINAASFGAVLITLYLLPERGTAASSSDGTTSGLGAGFRYLRSRPDLCVVLTMFFLIGAFGLNFSIYISTMSISIFHGGVSQYGGLMSMMALGSVGGTLIAARLEQPTLGGLLIAALLFAVSSLAAACAPDVALFGVALIVVGGATQAFSTSANSLVQLSTVPTMRGRMIAVLLACALGGVPLGAPLTGWVADHFGSRWAVGIGAAAGLAAAAVAGAYLLVARSRDEIERHV